MNRLLVDKESGDDSELPEGGDENSSEADVKLNELFQRTIVTCFNVPVFKEILTNHGDFLSMDMFQQVVVVKWFQLLQKYYLEFCDGMSLKLYIIVIEETMRKFLQEFGKSLVKPSSLNYLAENFEKCKLAYKLFEMYIYLISEIATTSSEGFQELKDMITRHVLSESVFGDPLAAVKFLSLRYTGLLGVPECLTLWAKKLGQIFDFIVRQDWFGIKLEGMNEESIGSMLDLLDFLALLHLPCSKELSEMSIIERLLVSHRDFQLRSISCCQWIGYEKEFPLYDTGSKAIAEIYLSFVIRNVGEVVAQRNSTWLVCLLKLESIAEAYFNNRRLNFLSDFCSFSQLAQEITYANLNLATILTNSVFLKRLINCWCQFFFSPMMCSPQCCEPAGPYAKTLNVELIQVIFSFITKVDGLDDDDVRTVFKAFITPEPEEQGLGTMVLVEKYPKVICDLAAEFLYFVSVASDKIVFWSSAVPLTKVQTDDLWLSFSLLSLHLNTSRYSNLVEEVENYGKIDIFKFVGNLTKILLDHQNMKIVVQENGDDDDGDGDNDDNHGNGDQYLKNSLRLSAGILLFLIIDKFPMAKEQFSTNFTSQQEINTVLTNLLSKKWRI